MCVYQNFEKACVQRSVECFVSGVAVDDTVRSYLTEGACCSSLTTALEQVTQAETVCNSFLHAPADPPWAIGTLYCKGKLRNQDEGGLAVVCSLQSLATSHCG